MRFKTGFVVGAAVGYYLGARAGRERYLQIERTLDRARATAAYQRAAGQVEARIGDVRERAKATVSSVAGDAVDAVLGSEPEATWEPGLEFNPDYRPTLEEMEADLVGREPGA
ncbi:MAG: hypothetical protein MUE36_04965 [Acidimicrobiales bacterium]|jgi:hypothetical protein|nr:hypothetical protein [Acidimicrobiales bacterium]